MSARLPSHVEVSGLIRAVEAEGGFATVIRKGEREAGDFLVVIAERGANSRAYERVPSLDGKRTWILAKRQDTEDNAEFSDYLNRRLQRDPDLWVVELDIANGERFIGLPPFAG